MQTFAKFLGLAVVVAFAMALAVLCGDYGPWYFAWLVGTTMIILIAVAGGVSVRDATRRSEERRLSMLGDLEGLIIFIPFLYLGFYYVAYRLTRSRFN